MMGEMSRASMCRKISSGGRGLPDEIADRAWAAEVCLDRGWGKATQPLESGDDGAIELIHRIERVIVHPENHDSKNC